MKMLITDKFLYQLGWLIIRHLIVLDLAVAMFKVARGIARPPTLEMFPYISELHFYDPKNPSSGNFKFNLNL